MTSTDLMAALKIASVTFMRQYHREYSRQGSGTPREADLAPSTWTAQLQTAPMYNDDIEAAAALLEDFCDALDTFYAWNPRKQYPTADPDGTILAASTVTIYALSGNTIRLAGLPPGYVLGAGDFLHWDQGSPAHRRLHRFLAGGAADGGGILPATKIGPPIAAGASTGLAVTLKQPAAEMMIRPGTLAFPSVNALMSTMSFTADQVP